MNAPRTRGIFGYFTRRCGTCRKIVSLVTLFTFALPVPAFPQQIIPDGRTGTTLSIRNNVTDVSTTTIRGANAYNSFSKFDVYQGNVVNLHVPGSAANLLNLVHGQASSIDGLLNAYKDGRIGGNVFFANPNGFVVGASGVINVGALSVITPTRSFMDEFFLASGIPSDSATAMMLNGTAPIDPAGLISIQGKVNALRDISISAGNIAISGVIASGAVFAGSAADFSDVVNVAGVESGSVLSEENGNIYIRASNDIEHSGVIRSDGATSLDAGNIGLDAGGNISLKEDSIVSARGLGENSAGGDISVFAGGTSVIDNNAVIDARGGTVSGDGGFIEASAADKVILAGGVIHASAISGTVGTILIDPNDIEIVSGNQYTDGANFFLQARQSLTVNPGVIISTRDLFDVNSEDHLTALSRGKSGHLLLQAPEINLNRNSKLLAFANNGFGGGDVFLLAGRSDFGATSITLDNALIKARSVSLLASSSAPATLLGIPNPIPSASSAITVINSTINATADVNIGAAAGIDVATANLAGLPVSIIKATSSATVDVGGNSTITAGSGNVKISADSTVKTVARPDSANSLITGDSAVAVSDITSTASVHVGGTSSLNAAGEVNLGSTNTVVASSIADPTATQEAAGASVAVTKVSVETRTSIDDHAAITGASSAAVTSESNVTATTTAKSAVKGAQEDTAKKGEGSKTLAEYEDLASTSEGSMSVAGGIAVAVITNNTTAYVDSAAPVATSGNLAIASKSTNASSVTADGSATTGTEGVGSAVAINVGVLANKAYAGGNISANGITIEAGMAPVEAGTPVNAFETQAVSGAGASNVGVAGALGVNVLANENAAYVRSGAEVDLGGGDIGIDARNNSKSSVTVKADVKNSGEGDEPAKVGVGASVGMNVAVNVTRAEIEEDAAVTNAGNGEVRATSEQATTTTVEGGAAGSKVSVTPLVAVTIAADTTTATIGNGDMLDLDGGLTVHAEQKSGVTTEAKGQTEGDSVAVGASVGATVAAATVVASVDRDVTAGDTVAIEAVSEASSSTTATASAKGGHKADADDKPTTGDPEKPGKTVDEQVKANVDKGKASGAAAGVKADQLPADDKKPKAETSEGAVSVAAAVGVNVGVATSVATVAAGRKIESTGGPLKVSSISHNDAKAKADGSQVDGGSTNVGVGAAVGLNVGVTTNVASIADDTTITTKGVTVSARTTDAAATTQNTNDYSAEATSGAGAKEVGVAGSLGVNIVSNVNEAYISGDTDKDGKAATIDAGGGDVKIDAQNNSKSTVTTKAEVKNDSGEKDKPAAVGVGASIGMNVGVNVTRAEIEKDAEVINTGSGEVRAKSDQTMSTTVEGGASGSKVSVTPLVAVSIAADTTIAKISSADNATNKTLDLDKGLTVHAEQKSGVTTEAKGQTEGDSVAVGASVGATVAAATVVASVDRDVTAGDTVAIEAVSEASSSTTATASAKGGHKADAADKPTTGDPAKPGKTVDEQVKANVDKSKESGAAAGVKADQLPADDKKPKAETSEGAVSVAAAVGVNVGVATSVATVAAGRKIESTGGPLKVSSISHNDAKAKADGSQVDGGSTNVGVGAAVGLNVGVTTNVASIADDTTIKTKGVTVSARTTDAAATTQNTNDYSAEATSGAGAKEVGVAGSLGVNVVSNVNEAYISGDTDKDGKAATIDAGGGDVKIDAQNSSKSTVTTKAVVKNSGEKDKPAAVGVGASLGLNVGVNVTRAEIEKDVAVTNGANGEIRAKSDQAMTTTVEGGASGAKVSVTPLVAVSIGVNKTTAKLADSATDLVLSGTYTSRADQTSTMTTKATGQTQGDVAVGASLAAAIAVDTVSSTVERNLTASTGLDLAATSNTSITTEAKAGAKGAKENKGADGKPAAGTTVDEQKKTQLDFAKGKNAKAADVDTTTPEAKTPDTSSKTPDTKAPTNPPAEKEEKGKKVSVAAAIGASVAYNQAKAEIAAGKTIDAGTGKLKISAETGTNYRTLATGEAVSDDVGVAAAVALTATYNKTQANLGAGATVTKASDIDIAATSKQNRDTAFRKTMSAEAVSGASGGEVAVAGSLAVVGNYNETRASIDEGVTIGTNEDAVDNISVKSDDTSKVSAQARAGTLSTGDKSKAGVGASFAVLLSYNQNTAAVGYDANKNSSFIPTNIHAGSLTVNATKNRVWFEAPTLADAKNFVVNDVKNLNFDALDPSTYLGSNNYYTEAVAGAAAKGSAAVAGAFSVNVFGNTTESYLGQNVNVTTGGSQPEAVPGTPNAEKLGVEISSRADTQAISFAGAVAGAKKAGVGISNTDIINLDQTLASVGSGSTVTSTAADAGIKVSADSRQDIANVSVSAGAGTESTGVGGVLGVIVSMNKTEALVGDGATVRSKGDVAVKATNDATLVMVAGGVAGGKEVGVGGAVGANILANKTAATIARNAHVDAKKNVTVAADADETAVTAVVAGAGGGKAGVAAALSLNVILSDTSASVGEGAKVNTDPTYAGSDQNVAITARDDTVVVGIAGGGAGGGKAGVGAALDTTVVAKGVKAFIADDTDGADVATVKAAKEVVVEAAATENVVSTTAGFAGGGSAGVGGAVSIGVVKNDVLARVGTHAAVDSEGNVRVNAEDDIVAVLTAGSAAGGGDAGVGGSLAVATLLGTTKAQVADGARVSARGKGAAASVYTGEAGKAREDAKGLSVTAYTREDLITTVASGAGGGKAGVAATVSANVIATNTEASIGRSARINETNGTAGADQEVRVRAVDETVLVNTAAGAGGGGSAGVGAAANVGVIAKTTKATVGKSALINAKKGMELGATSSEVTVSTTAGFAGGGSAGVGGSVGGVALANTTEAAIENAANASEAAKVNVSGGNLTVEANDLATSTMITGSGAGGGAAGVGVSLAALVNASTTKARIGNYAETNASGTTAVHAGSTENLNTITVAGAGGGSAGVAGTIAAKVAVTKTEAGIGDGARVNQDGSYSTANQSVDVRATDRIITVGAGGAGAGGGAAGVGGTLDVTFAMNTTSAYIGNGAQVNAAKDVTVEATSEKYVNSVTVAGAGGGAAGVAGAVSVIAVGSLFDGEAQEGMKGKNTQQYADGQTTKSAVGDMLGSSNQAKETKGVLDGQASKMAIGKHFDTPADKIPLKNTQAFIGYNAKVNAGEDVRVAAIDKTLAIVAAGSGAGGGAAGVSGSFGVMLLHDAAAAFIADGAKVNAKKLVDVSALTSENVFNVAITGSGAGAASVNGAVVVNVVSSDTDAYIGAAEINQDAAYRTDDQSVSVNADSTSNLVTVGASGGGAGAAAVGGVVTTNVLTKDTKAFIGEGADVAARNTVAVVAASRENVVTGAVSIRGAGAAGVGAVASANVVTNTTEAYVGAARNDADKVGATVDSDGNVKLSATDDTLIVAVSAVGNGAGAAGVGLNVGANVIANETRSYVSDNTTVNARGNAAGIDVYNGTVGAAGAMASLPEMPDGTKASGKIDIDGDGTPDGDVSNGATFNVKAEGNEDGSGGADNTVDPASKGLGNKEIPGASGGIGAKGTDSGVKGLSIAAVANEKIISATIGVAGAGAAAVTGAASANVVTSQTEAFIGDGSTINSGAITGADQSVRLTAADNTLIVQTAGTISGAGAAAVSGAANVGVVAKQTGARIGAAEVNARNVAVNAISREDIYTIGANLSVAGAAGVGAAAGVDVVRNRTAALIGAGAAIDATGDIAVKADQDTLLDIYTVSGAGGIVGVSGAVSVGVIDNETKAYVEGAEDAADAATLDAGGTTEVAARSNEDVTTVTVSGAGGGVGVAGAVGVKVVSSATEASIGANTKVNQTRSGDDQDVIVSASDTVSLSGGGGSGAITGLAGVGAAAEINIVRNTTTASVGDSAKIAAGRDLQVVAGSTRNIQSAAVAASGGAAVGISGAVSLAVIGAGLDGDSQGSIGSGKTASFVDSMISDDKVTGQLGDSEHVQGMKTDIKGRTAELEVSSDLNETSGSSLDKTSASIGRNAVVAAGRDIDVSATDSTKLSIVSGGLGIGAVGVGGGIGIATIRKTTEAFVGDGTSLSAGGDITISAVDREKEGKSSSILALGGAAGLVGLGAAVAYLDAANTTRAYLGSDPSTNGGKNAKVAKAASVLIYANEQNTLETDAIGASIGLGAVGGSYSRAKSTGTVEASVGNNVAMGKSGVPGEKVGSLTIQAIADNSVDSYALAGAAGIVSGAGAAATARNISNVTARTGSGADVDVDGELLVDAKAAPRTKARSEGVSAGLLAVGASMAVSDTTSGVNAYLGASNIVNSGSLTIKARTLLPDGGITGHSYASASAGGLVGINATSSEALNTTTVNSYVGDNSLIFADTILVTGNADTKQTAESTAATGSIIAAGGNSSTATSNSNTSAYLGSAVNVVGDTLAVSATGTDDNFADAVSGSGGVISGAAAKASTDTRGSTKASIGNGRLAKDRSIVVGDFDLSADHTSRFNARTDSMNASLIGGSGAYARNDASYTVEAKVGDNAVIKALTQDITSTNRIRKSWLSGGRYNVDSGSGGLFDLPAARSETYFSIFNNILIGQNAELEIIGSRYFNPGTLRIEGFNDIQAYDRTRLDSGGAIAIAKAQSVIVNEASTAGIGIGSGASLKSLGDVDLSVRTKADIQARANAKTYGAAGAAEGGSTSSATVSNSIDIGSNVSMLAYGDINLRAGQNSSGLANDFDILANTDLWNKTLFPVETKPNADAYLKQSDTITLKSGSLLRSAGNMWLITEKGDSNVKGYGVGKDLYREMLAAIGSFFSNLFGGGDVSLDIKGGSSTNLASTGVKVDGVAEVGIENKRYLYIKADGTVDEDRTSNGITVTKTNENLANTIQERIDELNSLITSIQGQTGASTSTNPQAVAEIANLTDEKSQKISAYNLLGENIDTAVAQNETSEDSIAQNNINITSWQTQLANLDPKSATYTADKTALENNILAAQTANTSLQNSIDENNRKISGGWTYEQDGQTYTVIGWTESRAELQTRIGDINVRIGELQATLGTDDGGTGVADLIARYQTEKAMLEFQLAGLGNTTNVGILNVDQPIVARSSNIYIQADNLTGSGKLNAPGDTLIQIRNESANFLRTNAMTIPDEAGGRIYFNNAPVSSVEAINARNFSVAANFNNANIITADKTTPRIVVVNAYIPTGTERAPDIFVDGDIRNLNGEVEVTSTFGSVLVKEGVDVVADTIKIAAGRDVTIGYKDGFRNIAGDVKEDWATVISGSEAGGVDRADSRTIEQILGISGPYDPSVLAGNNVFIAGQYLNINGVVQSGLPVRELTIPGWLAAEIADYKTRYDADTTGTLARLYKGLSINAGIESDISRIPLYYDAVDNVLEVAPVTIMGGYMELFGHIMNTGTGELRVMDGYGTIGLTNNTPYALRLKTLNTGSGIEGTIKITDTGRRTALDTPLVTYIKRLGTDVSEFNNFATGTVDFVTPVNQALNSRSTEYRPLDHQYYTWTTRDRATWSETANYYEEKWFGFTTSTKFSWGGTTAYNRQPQVPISADVVRVVPSHGESYWYDRTYYLDYTSWGTNGHWYNDVWALLYTKYHQVYNRSATETVLHNHNIAAFNPIKINFLGNDTGLLTVNSAGGIIIDGQIKNSLGTTTLTSGSSILQGSSDGAKITGQHLTMNAATGIGTDAAPVNIDLVNSGSVTAETAAEDINLRTPAGNLVYDSLRAVNGNVSLTADTDIIGLDANSLIEGRNVILTAEHGGIGTPAAPVRVDTLASAEGGLRATSVDDMHIVETTGDLYLVKAESKGGNVAITAEDGSIIDNNAQQTEDTRARADLLKLYDEMLLKGEDAKDSADRTVSAYERQKTRDYQTYWKYRMRQAAADGTPLSSDSYSPEARVHLTDAERSYYQTELKWDETKILALEDRMTSEYHTLHAAYGSIGTTYNDKWAYTVERPKDASGEAIYDPSRYDATAYREWDTLIAGYSWTQAQLDNSIGIGVLKEVSDTETRIEDPNAKGRNILLAAHGAIGHDEVPMTINIAGRRWSDLTEAEKVAIMAAERNDINILSPYEVQITQREDVDVEATGAITATGAGNIYLGSEVDMNVARVETAGDLRLKGQKGIYAAGPGVVLSGRNAIIEAGDNSIGTADTSLLIDLSGTLTARAGDSIFLREATGDVTLESLFAVHRINLFSPGSILAAGGTAALDIRAESLYLNAKGSAGAAGAGGALDIGLDGTGELTADIDGDMYVNSPSRSLTTGRIRAGGNIVLSGGADIKLKSTTGGIATELGNVTIDTAGSILDGDSDNSAGITAQNIDLAVQTGSIGAADNDLEINALSLGRFKAAAPLGIYVAETAGDFNIDDVSSDSSDVRLSALGGDIVLGTVNARSGSATLIAEGTIVERGNSGSSSINAVNINLTAKGAGIGEEGNYFDVDASTGSISVSTPGDLYLRDTDGQMGIGQIEALSGNVRLLADGSIVDTEGDGASDIKALNLTVSSMNGSVGTAAKALDIDLGAGGELHAVSPGDIAITETDGDLNIRRVASAAGDVTLNAAAGNANIKEISATLGTTAVTASGSILNADPAVSSNIDAVNINLNAGSGSIGTKDRQLNVDSTGSIAARAAGDIAIIETTGDMNIAQVASSAGDVTLKAVDGDANIETVSSRLGTTAVTAAGSILNADSTVPSNITAELVSLNSQSGSIGARNNHLNVDSSGIAASAMGDVAITEISGDMNISRVASAAGDVTLNVAAGNVNIKEISSLLGTTAVTASGSILNADPAVSSNVDAVSINLNAGTGSIGTKDRQLNVDSTGSITASAAKDVNLTESMGDMNIAQVASSAGDVTLTAAAGDAHIRKIRSQAGTTAVTASGSIVSADTTGSSVIDAVAIDLNAQNGSVGATNNHLKVDSSGIAASAVGNVAITEISGDMNISRIASAAGDVTLNAATGDANLASVSSVNGTTAVTASGSILNAGSTAPANIQAVEIDLTAGTGSIGTKDNRLNVDSAISITANAARDVNLTETTGDMNIGQVTSATGDVTLTAAAGDAHIRKIRSQAGTTAVTASGSIVSADTTGSSVIDAVAIDLNAQNGSIGRTDNYLLVDSSNSTSGRLAAEANQGIYLSEKVGDMNIDRIRSASGDVALIADGSVLNGASADDVNVTGKRIALTATNGSIGDYGNRKLVSDADAVINLTAHENIALEERSGDFVSDTTVAQTGSIDLTVPDGSVTIAKVTAPGTVSIQATGPAITISNIDPAVIDLRDPSPGAVISVDQADVSESVTVWADNVRLTDVSHTGEGTLNFDVRGGSTPLAGVVEIGATSGTAINFAHLYSDRATIDANVDLLSFRDARIGERADIANSRYRVVIDNRNLRGQPGDLQLYAPGAFSLQMSGEQRFSTNAFIVNFAPGFIVNGFSTENSVVGMTQKMLWTGKRQDRLYYNPLEPAIYPWQRPITPSGRDAIEVLPGAVGIGADEVQLKMEHVDVIFQ